MKKLFAVMALLFLLVLIACSSGGSGGGGDTTEPTTYSITGQVTSNSTGLAGVTVSLSGASTAQTTTDSSGNYSFTGQSDGDYTVTPSLSGYDFSPSGTVVTISSTDKAGIDFTATASTTPTYSISGTLSGAVASGVTITLAGTNSGSALTDASGNYSFSNAANGSYTVTPSMTGYTFSPASRSITVNNANITDQNFTATTNIVAAYSISGTVSGGIKSGVTITLTGTGSSSTTTDSSGNYSFSNAANGSYTVTPSKAGYTFSPASRSITVNNANTTDQNFTATATINAIVADHLAAADFISIPTSAVNTAKANLHIAYGHTSHGSQLITGMDALAASNTYSWNDGGTGGALDLDDYAMGGDAGYYPDWENNTRTYLGDPNSSTGRGTNNPDVNVIIWSWCGQVGYDTMTEAIMISNYLTPMTQLEVDYPGIKFIYMTGHLDGSGSAGNLNLRNQQIRDYCIANNKILFDFADIESYDPDGTTNYMVLNANDNCDYSDGNWATNWITDPDNSGNELITLANSCSGCAHSQGLNCALKGRAIWWLWARLAGWNP